MKRVMMMVLAASVGVLGFVGAAAEPVRADPIPPNPNSHGPYFAAAHAPIRIGAVCITTGDPARPVHCSEPDGSAGPGARRHRIPPRTLQAVVFAPGDRDRIIAEARRRARAEGWRSVTSVRISQAGSSGGLSSALLRLDAVRGGARVCAGSVMWTPGYRPVVTGVRVTAVGVPSCFPVEDPTR